MSDLIERIAQGMAIAEGPPGLGHYRQDSGLWYNNEIHQMWLRRARAAHQVMKEEMRQAPAPRPLPFLRT